MGKTVSEELVGRLRADDPNDYRKRHDEMLTWTGSAFLAGEPVEDEELCKARLYSFLCGTLGYLVAAEVTARNGHEAADMIAALSTSRDGLVEALEPFAAFIDAYERKPVKWDDEFIAIHVGTEFEASLHLSDLRAARAALSRLSSGEL